MKFFKNGMSSLRWEGRRVRNWRRRQASKKIPVPKGTVERIEPLEPTYTHADASTVENAHAVTAAIAAHAEHEAAQVHARRAIAQADQAASQDELGHLRKEQSRQLTRRDEYQQAVQKLGLAHKLVPHRAVTFAVAIVVLMAIMFETISMSSPMALLSAFDFGGSAQTRERVGAVLAMLLALGYAVVLAVLSKRAGAELKTRHYRHVIEAEHVDDEAAEDRPRTDHAVFADRMVAVAIVGGVLALLAASVVREAAVAILAAAGQNAVQVSWWVFLALTFGVFIGLVALGYWSANPIAKVHEELNAGIAKVKAQVDVKRRQCYRDAARVDAHEKELREIDARSRRLQEGELHRAAEEIGWRGTGSPHIYGVTVDPNRVHPVVIDPSRHVRDLTLPSLEDTLNVRLAEIRDAMAPPVKDAQEDVGERLPAPVDEDAEDETGREPPSEKSPLAGTVPFELEEDAVSASNGRASIDD